MMKTLVVIATGLSVAAPAYAVPARPAGSFEIAQVKEGTTGGRSGGPNQSQYVVPEGATGGRSGGPNQSQYVKKSHASHGKKHSSHSKKHKKHH